MPLISFVMPNRNKELYISEAIDSLRGQTLEDIEIVVVDDDSTDDSRDIIDTLANKDKRIKKVYLEPICGLPIAERIDRARNLGNLEASSDIICVADSDDWNLQERAKLTYDTLRANKQCGLFYGAFLQRDQYGKEDTRIPSGFPAKEFSREQLKRSGLFFIGHLTVGYKKETIVKFPYNTTCGVGDWGMFYNLLVKQNIKSCFSTDFVCVYRVYGDSIKELSWDEHCDKDKTQYLWDKKQKKMETLGGLENVQSLQNNKS